MAFLKSNQDREPSKLSTVTTVICLATFVIAFLAFAVVAMAGKGEDPPKAYLMIGAWSCGLFTLSAIVGILGWLFAASSKPAKGTVASDARPRFTEADFEEEKPDTASEDD